MNLKINKKKCLILFTQHGHKNIKDEKDSGSLGRWWGDKNLIHYGSSNWELLTEIKSFLSSAKHKEQYPVLTSKNTYDAFIHTDLEARLNSANVGTVIISGVMTNLCCETTARSAFCRGFDVIFLEDGTGTSTQKMHEATLLNMSYGFAKINTCRQVESFLL